MDSAGTLLSASNLGWKLVGVFFVYVLLTSILSYISLESRYLRSLEWSGLKKQWFGRWRATLSSLKSSRQMIFDGYEKFSKSNKAFALPNFGGSPMMILPPEGLKEVLQKSDEEVDLLPILQEATATWYTGAHDIAEHPFHIDVVRHQLTRKLHLLTEDIHAELVLGFEDQWEATNEWRTVPALATCTRIVSRAANRVFSGAELCRNQEFLDTTRVYGEKSFMAGAIMGILPKMFSPLAAPLITRWVGKDIETCKKYAVPIIERRIKEFQSGEKREPQHDALDWIIEQALKVNDAKELDPDRLCRRIMRLNLAAIHTTSISSTNALLDLYSSPRADDFIAGLREECERVLVAHDGKWTKAAVNDLKRLDSAIKESMRMTNLGMVGVARVVKSKSGITLSNGLSIPAGVRVTAPNAAIHMDPQYYDRPDVYDAFRFSDETGVKGQAIATTSMQFLPFGHGRHACPGRFFASQEMKLMLAYIVMNYDVKLPGERIKNFEFKSGCVPDTSSQLQIRLRQR